MTLRISAVLLALLLALLLAPAPPQAAQDGFKTEKVTLALQPLTRGDSGLLPYVVAREKGFFKEQGLDLQVVDNQDGKLAVKTSDIEILNRTEFYMKLATTPLRCQIVTAAVQDKSAYNDAIMVRADLKAASLKEVPSLASFPYLGGGPACDPVMRGMLKEAGLNPAASEIKKLTLKEFRAAKPGAAYVREPFLSLFLKDGSYRILTDGPIFADRALTPWPMVMTVFRGEFLKSRPETARRAAAALDKALAFIRENPKAAEDIFEPYVQKVLGVKGVRPRQLKHLRSDELAVETIQGQSDWYFNNKIVPAAIDAAGVIYRGR